MRSSIIAALVLALGLCGFVRIARAADDDKNVKVSGVVIDQMCGEKMTKKDDPQKAAEAHKKDCALKCGPEAGYAIISEGKMTKLSADSKDKVEEYLKKDDSKTEVTISGTKQDDGTIKVNDIMAKS